MKKTQTHGNNNNDFEQAPRNKQTYLKPKSIFSIPNVTSNREVNTLQPFKKKIRLSQNRNRRDSIEEKTFENQTQEFVTFDLSTPYNNHSKRN